MKKNESLKSNTDAIKELHGKIYNDGYAQGFMTAIKQERNFIERHGEVKQAYNCGSVEGFSKGVNALAECIIYLDKEMSSAMRFALFDSGDIGDILERYSASDVMRIIRSRKALMQTE